MDLKYLFIIITILLVSCKGEPFQVKKKYYKEVKKLTELKDRKNYLEKVYGNYIELRKEETDSWNTYGRRSVEYKNLITKNHKEDIKDLQRVIAYLETYGHPNIMKLGRKAAFIPCVQLIHSRNEVLLIKNYKYLYDAYKFNDITEDLFFKYLQQISFSMGEDYFLNPKISIVENIDYLIEYHDLNQ